MNQFNKTKWSSDGNNIRMSIEFSKVNKQKRLISGWATIDNVDTENDVVTAEASREAFERARGNLREMHKKDSAVGRIVSFKQDEFRAPDGKKYTGMFVTARISEGAQDTWLKILDGTLSGFSIGGNIVDFEEEFNKDSNEKIRKITRYDLNELSVVDNPGNQYSDITNIFKFTKSADGSVTALSGMVEEHKILNVFYCDEDAITQEKAGDSYDCPVCTDKMSIIGFIEDGGDRDEKVNTLVTKYLGHDVNREGGEEMAKSIKDEETVVEEEVTVEEVSDVEEVESAPDVDEVHDDGEEIAKKIDELKGTVTKILEKSHTETSEKIDALEKSIKDMGDSFDTKAKEFETKLSELDKSLETAKSRLSGFEKSLNKINSGSAFRKSVDFEKSTESVVQEDPWEGSAFSVTDLIRSA